ncbi:threonine aldolase [Geovibrio thiophilus]|uniref:Threonine aldolase n=1 Tax=Geovibrio thiophilus TaxID=139438 RepID=A0A3R5XWT2_9BACT|nr:beta-eliminating lyase-related protein [Geovibrio thiophilus]QAR32537.1 threonine aldolase [Geovibrio thiophilus]
MYQGFFSDNCAGILPEIMDAIISENNDFARPYGYDQTTAEAREVLKKHLGDAEVNFMLTGTGTNVSLIASALKPYQAVICPETAHINVDECGAPERFTSCRLLPVPSENGKLNPKEITKFAHYSGFEHNVQPAMVSISQATEAGSLYTVDEIKEIARVAHENGMFLHMDGARITNAACAMGKTIGEISGELGVDLLSLGGTKAGMMFGEAAVFFNKRLAENFKYIRKQSMQLLSKYRFVAAQFKRMFEDDLWLRAAEHANSTAAYLGNRLEAIDGVKLSRKPEVNAVFAQIPRRAIDEIIKEFGFYIWNEELNEVRLMTNFATEKKDIDAFTGRLAEIMKAV